MQRVCDCGGKSFFQTTILMLCTGMLPIFFGTVAFAQQVKFNHVINAEVTPLGGLTSIAQDHQGYIWFSAGSSGNAHGGLYRYDGFKTISFVHNPKDTNSLNSNYVECMIIDSSNRVWMGCSGLDRYDPASGVFTHFKHDPKNSHSLAIDNVMALLEDHKGNIWVGTTAGLDMLDKKTGQFTHYYHISKDSGSLSNNFVRVLYEDRSHNLWVGCGNPFDAGSDSGGLNRFNPATEKFTRYLHIPADPNSLADNKVSALMEDSKANFWVGTAGDGLHIMDRSKGTFTHYPYDPVHPEKLSRPPVYKENWYDHIRFIKEDITGAIWIGTVGQGINRYDPRLKKIMHYGSIRRGDKIVSAKDTAAGCNDFWIWSAFNSKDGLFWISSIEGNLYTVNPLKTEIPYYSHRANSFYEEPGTNTLWIATLGLVRKDLVSGTEKTWRHDPNNNNSLCSDLIGGMRADDEGKLWLTTADGLSKFDPSTNHFINYSHNEKDKNSLSSNFLNNLLIDHDKNIWIGTGETGLDKLNPKTNEFTHFEYSDKDTNSISSNSVIYLGEDKSYTLWLGTIKGVNSLNYKDTKFRHYLNSLLILSICVDAKETVWAGTDEGLYYHNKGDEDFLPYTNPSSQAFIGHVVHILEDKKHNLWVSTFNGILKINEQRNKATLYGANYGVHNNNCAWMDNIQGWDGQLFIGDLTGYYAFYPDNLKDRTDAPSVSLTSFKLGDNEVKPAIGGVLETAIWNTKAIHLNYDQNVFSIDFTGIHYDDPAEVKYLFKLENYDNTWRNMGTDHTAYFFNVPPGKYIFHAKATAYGLSGEKIINIMISPPWWKRWWAYVLYLFCFTGLAFFSNRMIRNRIIEKERSKSRENELKQQATELKMQALRAQMNPHFIFNSLNSINRFIMQNNRLQASEYLTKFSRLVRLILQNSEASLISLESELESVKLYLSLEALRFDDHFEYKLSVDPDLDISALKVPPLIIQPYAENAVWHGLMHKEEKGQLDIELWEEADFLYIKIADNGVGREQALTLASKTATRNKSMGLSITESRIARMQPEGEHGSPVVINDLVDPDGAAAGTEVIIKLPIILD
jgi:ligand-binding sensor domain-containing protein